MKIKKEIKIKMKTVLFARVSTREQAEEGYSLPAQEKLLKEYSTNKDFTIAKTFSVPESASGKQERKLFNELLDYLIKHPDVKHVICEKVDRISRNFKDGVKLDEWVNEDEERQLHFVKQALIIHKNSKSNEKFMWDIFLAMARQYSNNLSEETRKGLVEKAEQGWYPGNHKRGYKTIGDIGHKIWAVDEDTSDHRYIEMAFVMYNTGNYTLRTLAKELYKQGWSISGKPISVSELHKLISDNFYCGEFMWHRKKHDKAKHTPLISKELFYSVQDRLQRKVKAGKYIKHDFLFGGGLMICGDCGRTITWETQKGHYYGRCTKYNNSCNQIKYNREENIQGQVVQIFDSLKIKNKRVLDWVIKALKESHKDEFEYHESTLKELDSKLLQVEKRLSVLYDDRVDGLITKEQYEKKRVEYESQAEAILQAKENHVKADIDYRQLGINIFELSQKGAEIYKNKATMEEKREFLNFVFLNLKLKDEKVYPTFQNGFEVVAERAKDGNWLPGRDSNPNFRVQSATCYHYTTGHCFRVMAKLCLPLHHRALLLLQAQF